MELLFLGAAGTVTGSKHRLTSGKENVLIDCGLFQGVKALRTRNWDPLPRALQNLDAVILTHAHIDHSGYLPVLVREGFTGPIYCTPPTADLCEILLQDSARLHEEEAWYANKKDFSRHKPALPLYTRDDARKACEQLQSVRFGEEFVVGKYGKLTATYHVAGHILGAASVSLTNGKESVHFSGDLGRMVDPMMPTPVSGAAPDTVIMESTYGDRDHPDRDPVEVLGAVVNEAVSRGGKVLMSAFAVGRAQLLLYDLHHVFERGLAPKVPVFLDSPMATDVTELYMRHHEHHRLSRNDVLAMCTAARFIRSREESKALNSHQGPAVIVSASGMLSGGRILHHLKRLIGSEKNTIVLPGFQAPETRGADLVSGAKSIKIHGDRLRVRAQVEQLHQFSAHGDRRDLVAWLRGFDALPRSVHLVHGEPEAAQALAQRIQEEFGIDAQVAVDGERVDLHPGN